MARFELKIGDQPPCSPDAQEASGVFICNLHRWGSRGIEHSFTDVGTSDPTDLPLGELMQVLLQIAEGRAKQYRKKEEIPFGRLLGMSVVRACIHPYESPAGRPEKQLIGELVASYGFVPDLDHIYPAEYSALGARISENGVSTSLKVHEPDKARFVSVQHLIATPAQQSAYPVTHAIPSLASTRKPDQAFIALRAKPDETSFVETLASYERLMDEAS